MRGKSISEPLTLFELNSIIAQLVCVPDTTSVWITAEISDFSLRRHCYMELVQKNDRGETVAKARATIWANTFHTLDSLFYRSTGTHLDAGQKVMLLVSSAFHPAYGLSLNVTGINPEFTLGDMVLRRRAAIDRLTAEGIIDMNRSLQWCEAPLRIAVISSATAAGYTDFMEQLTSNPFNLAFTAHLYAATVQGNSAAHSIISALEEIAMSEHEYDGVVIIRGGGASDDLACFEDYDLAANIAQFPLPVMIGIGHEKDITLLDYVANIRVKTPTAAAAWLIDRGAEALARLDTLEERISAKVSELIAENKALLSQAEIILSTNVRRILDTASAHLDMAERTMAIAVPAALSSACTKLDNYARMLDLLSIDTTLRRGFTLTLRNGKAMYNPDTLRPGDTIETIYATAKIKSTVK